MPESNLHLTKPKISSRVTTPFHDLTLSFDDWKNGRKETEEAGYSKRDAVEDLNLKEFPRVQGDASHPRIQAEVRMDK